MSIYILTYATELHVCTLSFWTASSLRDTYRRERQLDGVYSGHLPADNITWGIPTGKSLQN